MMRSVVILGIIFLSFFSLKAQSQDYFEFQVQDPSAIQLTDAELGKLYTKHWYLIEKMEHRMGAEQAHWISEATTPLMFSWNGKISDNNDFRIILNKYILFKKKDKCYNCVEGLFSITKWNDSTLVLVKNFRSDYKWQIRYVYVNSNQYWVERETRKKLTEAERKLDKALVQKIDSIRNQNVWLKQELAKRDSLQKTQVKSIRMNIPTKYQSGKTVKTDPNTKTLIGENEFWNLYLEEQKHYSKTTMFQQFLENIWNIP